ncbi:MAG: carboxymuconolactone decarboxylase family protein [Bacteroides sp.]|nr:carboxymuconolactone decarboxylase family protein [Roseburia sp.]MCM1345828.1 carboxymuconolactone decarboxylase family protein [Bacteroides sp.]MCM1420218.1 carboxymuconolactone decarboxylase family protein [Bacteroides sp.]
MRILKPIICALLAMTPIITKATDINTFRQPYPAGQAMTANPNFTGTVWIHPLTNEKNLNVPMFNVTFESGCRNKWHRHSGGQILIATAGTGYYQEKGKPARRLFPGDIVEIAPDVEHWHGAAPDSWFAHIAIECNPDNNEVTWLEPVNDTQYTEATANQVVIKDLSDHQQAIVSIASYAAIGNTDELAQALTQGLTAGLTVNETRELLIQVYAYCGFPRSLTALGIFNNVLSERKAKGIIDKDGEAAAVVDGTDKYALGAETLSRLSGIPVDAPAPWYQDFAPGINSFLKEHLFADIFGRGILTYTDREIATVSMLIALGGVEPMATGHIGICRHLGVTTVQLNALLDIVERNMGNQQVEPIRKIVNR